MIQRWSPEAKVVKVFNILSNSLMVDPQFSEGKPDMFICGNETSAKETVGKLRGDFARKTIDPVNVEALGLLESPAIV